MLDAVLLNQKDTFICCCVYTSQFYRHFLLLRLPAFVQGLISCKRYSQVMSYWIIQATSSLPQHTHPSPGTTPRMEEGRNVTLICPRRKYGSTAWNDSSDVNLQGLVPTGKSISDSWGSRCQSLGAEKAREWTGSKERCALSSEMQDSNSADTGSW